jgi:hypothetical protein
MSPEEAQTLQYIWYGMSLLIGFEIGKLLGGILIAVFRR